MPRSRPRKQLSRAKARKMLHEGLSSAGGGFHSERQRRFVAARASGQPRRRARRRAY